MMLYMFSVHCKLLIFLKPKYIGNNCDKLLTTFVMFYSMSIINEYNISIPKGVQNNCYISMSTFLVIFRTFIDYLVRV